MLLDDLGDYLTTQGYGATTTSTGDAITVFKNFMPETPNNVIWMMETGGLGTVHAMHSQAGQAKVEQPHVQILVRHRVSGTARTTVNNVFKSLDGLREQTINGTRYLWVVAIQSPFFFDRDADRREIYAFNVRVVKELS